jgi:hypothetical protein
MVRYKVPGEPGDCSSVSVFLILMQSVTVVCVDNQLLSLAQILQFLGNG